MDDVKDITQYGDSPPNNPWNKRSSLPIKVFFRHSPIKRRSRKPRHSLKSHCASMRNIDGNPTPVGFIENGAIFCHASRGSRWALEILVQLMNDLSVGLSVEDLNLSVFTVRFNLAVECRINIDLCFSGVKQCALFKECAWQSNIRTNRFFNGFIAFINCYYFYRCVWQLHYLTPVNSSKKITAVPNFLKMSLYGRLPSICQMCSSYPFLNYLIGIRSINRLPL